MIATSTRMHTNMRLIFWFFSARCNWVTPSSTRELTCKDVQGQGVSLRIIHLHKSSKNFMVVGRKVRRKAFVSFTGWQHQEHERSRDELNLRRYAPQLHSSSSKALSLSLEQFYNLDTESCFGTTQRWSIHTQIALTSSTLRSIRSKMVP